MPDGIVIDHSGHIHWTNMGSPKENDGSIERVDLDGSNRTVIVSKGGTFTPSRCRSTGSGRKTILVRSRGHFAHHAAAILEWLEY